LAAVAVVAHHGKLLPAFERHLALVRDDADPFEHRIVRTAVRYALADPADEKLPFV
jgi:hypothetical protein